MINFFYVFVLIPLATVRECCYFVALLLISTADWYVLFVNINTYLLTHLLNIDGLCVCVCVCVCVWNAERRSSNVPLKMLRPHHSSTEMTITTATTPRHHQICSSFSFISRRIHTAPLQRCRRPVYSCPNYWWATITSNCIRALVAAPVQAVPTRSCWLAASRRVFSPTSPVCWPATRTSSCLSCLLRSSAVRYKNSST